jgi:hypothetical protein
MGSGDDAEGMNSWRRQQEGEAVDRGIITAFVVT